MSPTAANVIRFFGGSGSGGGAGTGGVAGAGSTEPAAVAGSPGLVVSTGSAGGVVLQPATTSNNKMPAVLFTQADSQHIDVCAAKLGPDAIQFIEVVDRANTNAMVGTVVNFNALDA